MISIVMYILTMLYVLYTYYNRVNDLVIEVRQSVGIPNSHFSTLYCLLSPCRVPVSRRPFTVCRGMRAERIFAKLF